MGVVIAALSISMDGFVAHEDDSGEVEVRWPGMGMVSQVTPEQDIQTHPRRR